VANYEKSGAYDAVYLCTLEQARDIIRLDGYYGERLTRAEKRLGVEDAWVSTAVTSGFEEVSDIDAMSMKYNILTGR